MPDTSINSYGTVTEQVRQYRDWSSSNVFVHKMQRYVYSSGPHTKTSYQDTKENQKKKNREGPCLWRISQDLQTRTPYEHPRRRFQTSTNAEHFQGLNAKTSWRGLKQHLQKIFSQGPRRECPPDRQKGLAAAGRDQTRSRCRNLPRACQKSFHTSAQDKHSWTAHKGTFMREFTHAAGQME